MLCLIIIYHSLILLPHNIDIYHMLIIYAEKTLVDPTDSTYSKSAPDF